MTNFVKVPQSDDPQKNLYQTHYKLLQGKMKSPNVMIIFFWCVCVQRNTQAAARNRNVLR